MEAERRFVSMAEVEDSLVVELRDDSAPKIRGIAPPWDSLSVDLGGFREKFASTAFDKILSKKRIDVPLLFNHDDSKVLARTTNGTLRITKEDRGLAYEADPIDTPTAAEVLTLIRTKTIFGSSFAFTTSEKGETWTEDERGNVVRTITEATGLYDISPVTRAAYGGSALSARSLGLWKEARKFTRQDDSRLVISVDYDRTFSAAPGLWRSFIADATARGHKVACVSRREDTPENREQLRAAFADLDLADLILCGTETQKRAAARAAGLEVDVWVDDYPEGIVEQPTSRSVRIGRTTAAARAAAAIARARLANANAG